MFTEYRVIAATSTGWKLPFNLAVLLHVFLLSSAIILPKYVHKRPILPEVYTVELISLAEPVATPASAPPPTQAPVKIQKLKTVEARKTAPIAPPIAETVQAAPVKAISIKPLKRKIKNKNAPDLHAQQARAKRVAEQRRQQRAMEAQRQQYLQEARRQQALAAAEAKAAASDAVNALKHSLQADAAASTAKTGQRSSARRSGGAFSALESQYYASITGHLLQYWALPDIKPWDPELTAVVVIVISKNGRIIKHSFEKRSGDRVFDQFVSRTIQEANPLPSIPAALKKQQYSIGLRFKPGEIQ